MRISCQRRTRLSAGSRPAASRGQHTAFYSGRRTKILLAFKLPKPNFKDEEFHHEAITIRIKDGYGFYLFHETILIPTHQCFSTHVCIARIL